MIKAWALVKMPQVITKAAGVTYGKRQKALEHLARYAPEQISIRLERERNNEFDYNAVAVIATVQGKGPIVWDTSPARWQPLWLRSWTQEKRFRDCFGE